MGLPVLKIIKVVPRKVTIHIYLKCFYLWRGANGNYKLAPTKLGDYLGP
jgi:hypothetical protein